VLGLLDVVLNCFTINLADRTIELTPRPQMTLPKLTLQLRKLQKQSSSRITLQQTNQLRNKSNSDANQQKYAHDHHQPATQTPQQQTLETVSLKAFSQQLLIS